MRGTVARHDPPDDADVVGGGEVPVELLVALPQLRRMVLPEGNGPAAAAYLQAVETSARAEAAAEAARFQLLTQPLAAECTALGRRQRKEMKRTRKPNPKYSQPE